MTNTIITNNHSDEAVMKIHAEAHQLRRMLNIPKPDQGYLDMAVHGLHMIKNNGDLKQHWRIQKAMSRKFAAAFHFHKDFGNQAAKFWRFILENNLQPKVRLFDHIEFFQREAKLVVLSQPYELDEAQLDSWARELGAEYTIAKEWSYHYPGRTSLFFVEFPYHAKAHFEKYGRHCVTLRHMISRLDELFPEERR